MEDADAYAVGMNPWEQHSGVIKLPRYDYNSPSSLLFSSPATKEAISILHKFVAYDSSNNPKEEGTSSKKRKLCTQDTADECFDHKDTESASANSAEDEGEKDGVACLSLVKLTRNGLLLLNFPSNTPPNTVNIVSNIIQALESGTVTLPVWCQSHFPYPSYLQFERKRTTRSSIKAC
ncbi:hypothetical protein GYH30_029388 [Glycine max]|nr:hypothetical protein GYH30_029388 [Glycine max]KAH1140473.1 hypothetical protein GYH30_029388 [Glycine max]